MKKNQYAELYNLTIISIFALVTHTVKAKYILLWVNCAPECFDIKFIDF